MDERSGSCGEEDANKTTVGYLDSQPNSNKTKLDVYYEPTEVRGKNIKLSETQKDRGTPDKKVGKPTRLTGLKSEPKVLEQKWLITKIQVWQETWREKDSRKTAGQIQIQVWIWAVNRINIESPDIRPIPENGAYAIADTITLLYLKNPITSLNRSKVKSYNKHILKRNSKTAI